MGWRSGIGCAALPLMCVLPASDAPAQETSAAADRVSCTQFMAPKSRVGGKPVGQDECRMIDFGVVDREKNYHRIDIGISGTLSGYVVKDGPRQNHFTSEPDFTYTQFGNTQYPRFHGILSYDMAKGTSLTVTWPETGWNGKLFILVHGSTGSFARGTLKPWDKYFDPGKPFDADKYERSMLARGYAVVRSRRNADRYYPGDFSAVLDDGTLWPDQNVGMVPELILDEVRLADNLLQQRLGRKPTRNYWYGHSAGTYTALGLDYTLQFHPDLNRDVDGRQTISGFLDDDPGGGLFLPILERNGVDVLYRAPQEKASFVKSIVISHQAYPLVYSNVVPGEFDLKHTPKQVSNTALTNKRTMAKLFHQKGMDDVFRMYEVRGISHIGDENLPTNRNGDVQAVHLSRVMDAAIDLLDNWVEKGIEPPKTNSDDPSVSSDPAIALPEVACPLGQYYAFPTMRGPESATLTSFAPYDGGGLEPLDGRLMYVDMNRDGRRDNRETVTQAWRRLGLLGPKEIFSRDKYMACVGKAAANLRNERFFTESTVREYDDEAGKAQLPGE